MVYHPCTARLDPNRSDVASWRNGHTSTDVNDTVSSDLRWFDVFKALSVDASLRSKLQPGTPIYDYFKTRSNRRNEFRKMTPEDLLWLMFDDKLRNNVESFKHLLTPLRVLLICTWIVVSVHYREEGARRTLRRMKDPDYFTGKVGASSNNATPIVSIMNMQAFVWRLFSTNINTPDDRLRDEESLREQWGICDDEEEEQECIVYGSPCIAPYPAPEYRSICV